MAARVSVFLFCKNRVETIRRSVESVLAQTFRDFEYVIQDGASTDGTLEALQQYGDPRIILLSEPDDGPASAFWRALRRCRGDYVCACLSDEELLPDAVAEAVEVLDASPDAVAVTRDAYLTDIHGRVLNALRSRRFNLVEYMANRFAPNFAAAMFRRRSLDAVGLHTRDWNLDCGEFELWCRLALLGPILAVSRVAAKYAYHDHQLSREPANAVRIARGRAATLGSIASETGLFNGHPGLLRACRVGTVLSFAAYVASLGALREAVDLYLTAAAESDRWPTSAPEASVGDYVSVARGQRLDGHDQLALDILEVATRLTCADASIHCEIAQAHTAAGRVDRALEMFEVAIRMAPDLLDAHWGRGVLLERRGQIDDALEAWRRSQVDRNPDRHSIYLAAALKSPRSTNRTLLETQREWARCHVGRLPDGAVP